jgi:hypothetical protein
MASLVNKYKDCLSENKDSVSNLFKNTHTVANTGQRKEIYRSISHVTTNTKYLTNICKLNKAISKGCCIMTK